MSLTRKFFMSFILIFMSMGFIFANVTVSLGDVEVEGYTEDIVVPVTLSNPNDAVGGFQFDVISVPTMVEVSGATPVDADNFSADYNVFNDGSARIVFYSNNGTGIASGGDDVVLNLHYDGSDVLSSLMDLNIYDLTVSDADGNALTGTGVDGSITIGSVTFLDAGVDTGDVNETVTLDIDLTNNGDVGGVQFDLFDEPDFLDVSNLTTTDRTEGFTVSFNTLENGRTRVLLYSQSDANIAPGDGPILNLEMTVHEDAYNSNVGIHFEDVTITDGVGGEYWIGGVDSGIVVVSPGYIEEPHNLVAQDGMDAQVLLNWDPPIGPIFSRPVTIYIVTDTWGYETTWQLTNDETGDIVEAYTDAALENSTEYSWDLELDFGAYTFTIFDSYGDGIYSPGGYAIYIDEEEIYSNIGEGWNGSEESFQFEVGAGRFSVTNRSFIEPLPNKTTSTIQELQAMNLTLGDPTFVASGSFTPWEEPVTQNTRPVELDSYNIYKSLNGTDFEQIDDVDGNTTTYLDEDVENSTTYHYYVTAVYPDGSESGPTNIVAATPVEWVELWMTDGASLSGQMDTIDFFINNESNLGLFYFEIMDYPDVLHSLNVLPTDRTSDWAIEIADQGDGTIAITGISLGTPLAPGDGAVCRAVVYPNAEEATTVNLSYTTGTSIQDMNYIELNWTAEGATYEVGIETQYVTLTGGSDFGTGSVQSSVLLANTQSVYGLQLDIVADPPFATGTSVDVSSSHDFSSWDISGDVVGGIYRVMMFDNSMSSPIVPGISHILDIDFNIAGGTPTGTIITLDVQDAVISDINNLPMHSEILPGEIYAGMPPVAFSIDNVNGNLSPGGTGSFEIHLTNGETANLLEFTLADLPENMTVTNITGVGRFDDGVVDGSSSEQEDGTYYFLGFDFASGIEPGVGPILEVEVQFDNTLINPAIIMSMPSVAAGDAGASPLETIFHGFGQFTGTLAIGDVDIAPKEFALHPNFPNPFNPSTKIVYDLASQSDVRLEIYNLMGQKVNTLVSANQPVGRHTVTWNATDQFGREVSAGVYLYRLYTSNKVFTRKMILMK